MKRHILESDLTISITRIPASSHYALTIKDRHHVLLDITCRTKYQAEHALRTWKTTHRVRVFADQIGLKDLVTADDRPILDLPVFEVEL